MSTQVLAGKVSLVIGASRGIGAAAARALAAAGAKVVLAARDARALEGVAAGIRASGGAALAVPTNIWNAAQVKSLIERTAAEFGRLDTAFNNAGSGHQPAPLGDLRVEDFDESIGVNLRGILVAMKFELLVPRLAPWAAV
jgi:NAD(P)-dependent dehydrogenase (short-subunit alcohol dehydrogenase family)